MNRLTMIRAAAATFALTATFGLFNSVVALSEPQRTTLLAATHARTAQAGAIVLAGNAR